MPEYQFLSSEKVLCDDLNGRHVYDITLNNAETEIHITNLGCAITEICIPDRMGVRRNIVAGYDHLEAYGRNPHYFGCIIGRNTNRIADGQFTLNGRTVQLSCNEGENHLHGGFDGFHKKIWEIGAMIHSEEAVGVILKHTSPDGEEGYPGTLQVQVKYMLDVSGKLSIHYTAVTDQPTPVNLSNHSYFNLSGFEDMVIYDHILHIHAAGYTEKNGKNLPTGRLLPLGGTLLDFSTPRRIGAYIDQFPSDRGFDHNYILDRSFPGPHPASAPLPNSATPAIAAELFDPGSGRMLKVATTQPGIQLYTANWWDGTITGKQGKPYCKHGAVALETQAFPDSPNHPAFPDTILYPGDTYRSTTEFQFGVI